MNSLISFDTSADLGHNFGFATYFYNLRKAKKYVDVTFVLETPNGKVKISAHQLVLAMRSSFFADEFYCDQRKRNNQTINVGEVNPKAFEYMISYCYGCQPALKTPEEICALFLVANQYRVISLVKFCHTCLNDIQIELENVFSLLEVAEHMEDERMKDACSKFVEENTRAIMTSYKLCEITPFMIHIILNLPKLSVYSEYELLEWIFEWAKAKSKDKDSCCGSIREYLENFLQFMNFLDLTFEEFARFCIYYPNIFTSDEIASICLNIAFPRSRSMPEWFNWKYREHTAWEKIKKLNEEIEDIRKSIVDNLKEEENCLNTLQRERELEEKWDESLNSLKKELFKLISSHNLLKNSTIFKLFYPDVPNDVYEKLIYGMKLFGKDDSLLETKEPFRSMRELLENARIQCIARDDATCVQIYRTVQEGEKLEVRKNFYIASRFMLIERIRKLSENHGKLQERLRTLIDRKLAIL